MSGFIVGCFIGWIIDKTTPGSGFVIDGDLFVIPFVIIIFWILGTIIGAVVGGTNTVYE